MSTHVASLRPSASGLTRTPLLLIPAVAFAVSVSLPLATHTVTLAAFGLAHVLSELRYVDRRFSPRLGYRLRWSFALLLGGVVLLRGLRILGWVAPMLASSAELALVVLLTASVLPELVRARNGSALFGAALVAGLVVGVIISPIHTILVLAILHNATPLGFLAELLSGRERRWAMGLGGLVFVGLPLLIASGIPFEVMRSSGWIAPEANILPAGPLIDHLGAYLHRDFWDTSWAFHAFCAFVFMQCMHYLAVIYVLPSLIGPDAEPTLPWPTSWRFAVLVGVLGIGLFVHFYIDFSGARAFYGVASSVHAWVELPLLLLALAPLHRSAVSS